MGAKQAMGVAQRLYEKGYITYMRTDSTALSTQAVQAARSQAVALYGDAAVPLKPRVYKSKSKNAQEAHEAIRPSGENFRTPTSLSSELDRDEQRLYDLIWKRTVASQMADAKYETTTVTIAVDTSAELKGQGAAQLAEFTASGTVYTFKGFLEAYEEGRDEKRGDADAAENQSLPAVAVGDALAVSDAEAKGHRTTPKPRYTEASLVKVLEEKGIGRPSTFASIPETILDRGYAVKRGQALVPTWLAFSVVRLLEEHFAALVDYDFTAALEDDLDTIARGEQNRVEWLKSFYFGSENRTGLRQVVDNLGEIDARALNSTRITDTATLRFGKYGPYLEVADPENPEAKPRIVNVPEDLAPDELTQAKAQELIDAPVAGDRVLGENPENGKIIVVKDGRFGPYVQENDPVSDDAAVDESTGEVVEAPKPKRGAKKETAPKPRTGSLFRSMSVDSIDLETALQLLSLPRVVGTDPESGEEITAQNGRFGPYLKKGTDSRSLESESQIFDVTLEQALEIYAQPKYGAGRRASSALAEFEADPVSGKPIRIRDGRFGAYVTDSETNVTIPRGQKVEDITFEIAVQMLADKRAKGPAPKRGAKKPAAKKAPAKKPAGEDRRGEEDDHGREDGRQEDGCRHLGCALGCGEEGRRDARRERRSEGGLVTPGRGAWITLEGGDGSGKTTQSNLLASWLTDAGRTVVRTREPGGSEVGQLIRDIVLHHRGDIAPRAEALLYAADRAHHVATVVRPALERGEVVLQDRYLDSSVAYQGAYRVLDATEIRDLSLWAAEGRSRISRSCSTWTPARRACASIPRTSPSTGWRRSRSISTPASATPTWRWPLPSPIGSSWSTPPHPPMTSPG